MERVKPFERNDMYEYTVVSIRDDDTGDVDVNDLSETLNNYALEGWRLRTALTNQLGVIGTTKADGNSTNATIDRTVLIFERRIYRSDETDDIYLLFKAMDEMKKVRVHNKTSAEELYSMYKNSDDRKGFLLSVIDSMGGGVSLAELRDRFGGKIDALELGTHLMGMVNERILEKDDVNKRYLILKK